MIADIWNSLCAFTTVLKPQLQPEVANHCLFTVQTALNFAACSFCCKITLICLGSSLSVRMDSVTWVLYLWYIYNACIEKIVMVIFHACNTCVYHTQVLHVQSYMSWVLWQNQPSQNILLCMRAHWRFIVSWKPVFLILYLFLNMLSLLFQIKCSNIKWKYYKTFLHRPPQRETNHDHS